MAERLSDAGFAEELNRRLADGSLKRTLEDGTIPHDLSLNIVSGLTGILALLRIAQRKPTHLQIPLLIKPDGERVQLPLPSDSEHRMWPYNQSESL